MAVAAVASAAAWFSLPPLHPPHPRYHIREARLLGLLLLTLLLMTPKVTEAAAAAGTAACPVGQRLREAPEHVRPKLSNNKGVDLLEEGRIEEAAVCFLAAFGLASEIMRGSSGDADAADAVVAVAEKHAEIALQNFREAQSDVLAQLAARPPYAVGYGEAEIQARQVREVWDELFKLMQGYNIATVREFAGLRAPFDVYMLHGQLICQKDEPEKAIRSLETTLRAKQTSDALLLLGRIHLGRGEYVKAFGTLLRAFEALVDEDSVGVQTPRLHAQDMRTAVLLTLHLAASRMPNTPKLAPQLHKRLCVRVRELAGDSFGPQGDDSNPCIGLAFSAPGEQYREWAALPLLTNDAEDATDGRPICQQPAPNDSVETTKSDTKNDQDFQGFSCPFSGNNVWLRAATAETIREFRAKGYVKLRNILPERYLHSLISRHETAFRQPHVSYATHQSRYTITNEELSIFINMQLATLASVIFGKPCLATYAFSILYIPGGHIKPHTDRHQNEVSLSLNLGLKTYVGEGEKRVPRKKRRRLRAPWPLYISPKGESEETAVPITMEVGEGVLYHGPEHVHFRRPLESGTSTQIIFGFRHVDRSHCNSQ